MGYRPRIAFTMTRGTPLMSSVSASPAERDRIALLFADIASEAGVAVMDVFNSDFETREKADSSPVSDADERAEEIILERLSREMPGVPVIAEEQAAADGLAHRRPGDMFILVDPVDGTREFVNKRRDFTVNIGLVADAVPIAGCVYAPAHQDMFIGGMAARVWTNLAPGEPAAPAAAAPIRSRAYPGSGLTAVVSSSHLTKHTVDFLDKLSIAERVSFGSSLKFCRIAAGSADVYPRWGPTMEWDTAAGHAILSAAGGCVMTPEGEPLGYGKLKDGFRNGPFIAWGDKPLA